ncbi:MAG: polyphosphate kinase 2 family protein [Beijerinckiaceae bacterium]
MAKPKTASKQPAEAASSSSVELKSSAVAKPAKNKPATKTAAKAAKESEGKTKHKISMKDLLKPYRITNGKGFHLDDHPTDDARKDFDFDKNGAAALLADGIDDLQKLQDLLYADNRWAVLLVFQAMDAAGKDSTIKHVMSGINPQGCQVHAFKRPSEEELDHDFLWRTNKVLPERGRIGIFNRSYYEEVLVVRVHPKILDKQRIPSKFLGDDVWDQRLKAIRHNEKFLSRQGVKVIKFFLHVGKDEQKKRLLERIDDPEKNWKFETGDLAERAKRDDYMYAYEEAIRATATKHAPWYVIPADDKKFMRVAVMGAIKRELKKLDLAYPVMAPEEAAKLGDARKALEADK